MTDQASTDSGQSLKQSLSLGAGLVLSTLWLLGVVTLGIGIYFWFHPEPEIPVFEEKTFPVRYESTAFLRLHPLVDLYSDVDADSKFLSPYTQYLESQSAIIQSRRLIEHAIRSATWQEVSSNTDPEAVRRFTEKLSARSSGQIIYVTFTDTNQKRAMHGARAVIDAYMELFADFELKEKQDNLKHRLVRLNEAYRSNRAQLDALANIYGTEQLDEIYQIKLNEANRYENEFNNIQRRLTDMRTAAEKKDPTSEEVNSIPIQQKMLELDQNVLKERYEKAKNELMEINRTRLTINQLISERRAIATDLNQTTRQIDSSAAEKSTAIEIEVLDGGSWPVNMARSDEEIAYHEAKNKHEAIKAQVEARRDQLENYAYSGVTAGAVLLLLAAGLTAGSIHSFSRR